jgi:hypothetical protein
VDALGVYCSATKGHRSGVRFSDRLVAARMRTISPCRVGPCRA